MENKNTYEFIVEFAPSYIRGSCTSNQITYASQITYTRSQTWGKGILFPLVTSTQQEKIKTEFNDPGPKTSRFHSLEQLIGRMEDHGREKDDDNLIRSRWDNV